MIKASFNHMKTIIKEIDKKNIIYFGIFILFNIIFTYFLFLKEKELLTHNIDKNIIAIANSIDVVLPDHFHDKALTKDSINIKEDIENINKLSKIANEFGVEHIYTFIKVDDKIHITSSSATPLEVSTGTERKYFSILESNNENILAAFLLKKDLFIEENINNLGKFRTVFIKNKNNKGDTYITAVDMKMSDVDAMLVENEKKYFLSIGYYFILIMSVVIPLFYILYTSIHKRAHYDFLTGLPNKLEFEKKAEQALLLSKRKEDQISILFLDLDGFKKVNDTLGHECGDKLLKEVALRILGSIRATDIPSRQGGDEFIIALPNTDKEGAGVIAAKLIEEIGRPYILNKKEAIISVSIGIASYPIDDTKLKELCKKADFAMYKAKENGKNKFFYY